MRCVFAVLACLLITPLQAADAPKFQVDPAWPKPLPNNWIMGQPAGVAVDGDDHVWVVQRPRTLTDDEKAASLDPPRSKCCVPAPPVMEFDQDGNLLRSWGGKGEGYDWPQNEHGIHVDAKGFVWLAGNGENDGQILKFTRDGKFVMQIGKQGPQTNSLDTTRLGRPANMTVDAATNELYVADGYANHRIIVFDAEPARSSGCGAPMANRRPTKRCLRTVHPPSRRNSSRTCIVFASRARTGLRLRSHQQPHPGVPQGRHVREGNVRREGDARHGAIWDIEVWPDESESFLLNADGTNNEVRILTRDNGGTVASFGRNGRMAGDFHWIHNSHWIRRATCSPRKWIPASARKNSCSRARRSCASARKLKLRLCFEPQPRLPIRATPSAVWRPSTKMGAGSASVLASPPMPIISMWERWLSPPDKYAGTGVARASDLQSASHLSHLTGRTSEEVAGQRHVAALIVHSRKSAGEKARVR